jgi:hypothetical protein
MSFIEGLDYEVIQREYNYRLLRARNCSTGIFLGRTIEHPYFRLDEKGRLTIQPGYEWNGATRAIDTKDFMRASLFHDTLYQMLRMQLIPASCRKSADKLLYKLLGEDGMSGFRRWYVYHAVRLLGWLFK